MLFSIYFEVSMSATISLSFDLSILTRDSNIRFSILFPIFYVEVSVEATISLSVRSVSRFFIYFFGLKRVWERLSRLFLTAF